MQEIKCPHCGEVFQVDEAGYAAIVKQVRDKEFVKEVERREAAAVELAVNKAEQKKEKELAELHAQLEQWKQSSQAEQQRAAAESEMAKLKDRQVIDGLRRDLEAEKERARFSVQMALQEQQLTIQE